MVVERRVGGSAGLFEAEGKAPERFARAEDRVGTGPVSDLFTAYHILLVTKLEGCTGDAIHVCKFIQRCGGCAVDGVVNSEVEVPELERL